MSWYVADMDNGILRKEPTRRAAVEWAKDYSMSTRVFGRFKYGPGDYDYKLGNDEEETTSLHILVEKRLVLHGYDPEQIPLYPIPEDPYHEIDREES